MITSGLVITLNANSGRARDAISLLEARSELTLGQCIQRWLPVAAEAADVRASHDLHDWVCSVPGVDFVDVVQVSFEDPETQKPVHSEVRHEH
jgi:hypothetical protein